jgi:putative flippase GtrA
VSLLDGAVSRVPVPLRELLVRHHELIKFAIVGATTMVIDMGIFYGLKLTVLQQKPVIAGLISGTIAVIASYILNREWSFKARGGRERAHEAFLFFAVSGIGVLISKMPLWVSNDLLNLRVPNISQAASNVSDFIASYLIGNLLQMAFRFWALRKWVFLEQRANDSAAFAGAEIFPDFPD